MKIKCPMCKKIVPTNQVNPDTKMAFCPRCNEAFIISESGGDAVEDSITVNEEYLRNPPKGAWFIDNDSEALLGASIRSKSAFFLIPVTIIYIYGTYLAINFKFFTLHNLPYLLIIIFLCIMTLLKIFGKIEIKLRGKNSKVFIGIGPLGRSRRFDWTSITHIRESFGKVIYPWSKPGILLEGKEKIIFGTTLKAERRKFILNTLIDMKEKRRYAI